ncbi:MAG: hypothetical protein ACFFFC_00205 [Candidatus Thorarchaeota archaeon]
MGRDHESDLREILEKVGQPVVHEATVPGVDDSDSADEHVETTAKDFSDGIEVPKIIINKPVSLKNLFVHHDTHPIVLDIKLIDKYKDAWFAWEPETLWREIMADFRTPSISDHVKSKIQAVRTIHISDWVFKKWEVFCPVIQAINNNIPDFEIMRRPTVSQLFAGIDIITIIRNDEIFSQEIQQFCGAALLDEGIIAAPQPIAFCQDEILEIQKEMGITIDPSPIMEKYKILLAQPAEEVVLDETPVDIQIAKLIIARDYMRLRRQQMTEQLRVLR